MSALTVTGVSKAFPPTGSGQTGTLAVDDVSLHVPHGSLTAVLGPSGCGKTTLLRLIAGFLVPDSGTIAFDDRVVAGAGRPVPPQDRRVGYVPQEGALFPHLDVAGNIGFGLPRGERGSGARIDEMLDLVELPRAFRTRAPHELSGGQQQRVALARALAPRPTVVLLDEPFSSLDASLRESTGRAVARALRAARATGLLVTHDQSEALSLSDQVAVLRDGRLIQAGSPADVYLAPHDPELARFVGGATPLPGRAGRGHRCHLRARRRDAHPPRVGRRPGARHPPRPGRPRPGRRGGAGRRGQLLRPRRGHPADGRRRGAGRPDGRADGARGR